MPKEIRFEGKTHVFPDDFTDADIQQALASVPSEAAPTASPPPGGPRPPLPRGLGSEAPAPPLDPRASQWTNYWSGALTGPGGAVGGVSGGILDMPRRGVEQIKQGAEQIAGAWEPSPRGAPLPPPLPEAPAGLPRPPLPSGLQPTPGENVAGGVRKIIGGAGQAAAPAALPLAFASAPITTAVVLGTGALAGAGTEKTAESLGFPPEYSALLGDVANLVAGGFGPKVVGGLLTRMKISPSGPIAELAKFADDHGIPISAAVRTGMESIRRWQARTATSKAARRSQAGTQAGLETEAGRQAGQPPTVPQAAEAAPPVPPEEAGRAAPEPPEEAAAPSPTPPGGAERGPTPEAAARGLAEKTRATRAEFARGARAAYSRLGEFEAANEEEVVTGTREVPGERPGATLTPAGVPRTEPIKEMIGLPVRLGPAKSRFAPLIDLLEKQLPPLLRDQSVGLQALRTIRDAPDVVPASVADGYLSDVKTLLRERGVKPKSARLLREALDAVSPAVDEAVARAGPEATEALAEGRLLTTAKYAVEGTMKKLKVPKSEKFPLEPVKLFRTLTAAGDVNIGLLEDVKKYAPESMPAVFRAMLEGLFNTALGRDEKLDPVTARKAWRGIGDTTKRFFTTSEHITQLDEFFRQMEAHHVLGEMFDLALGRGGKKPNPEAALRKWGALNEGRRRDLLRGPGQINRLNDFFHQADAHNALGKLFDLALGAQGKDFNPAEALRQWTSMDPAVKRRRFSPPEIAKYGRFFREATEHNLLKPFFDLALGRDGKLDPLLALRKWDAMSDADRLALGRGASGAPSVPSRRVSEMDQFIREAARHHELSRMFDLALGRRGVPADPDAALRLWNGLDAGTKRMLGLAPQEIIDTGRFFGLAALEAQTPRATQPGPLGATSKLNSLLFDLMTVISPELIGAAVGHEPFGRKASYAVMGLRALRYLGRVGGAGISRALARALWDPATARTLTEGIRLPALSPPLGATVAASARGVLQGGAQPPAAGSPPAAPTGADLVDRYLNVVGQQESRNRNVPNYRFDPEHTAQGYYQITNTNWRRIAPLVGIDTSAYPNAMSASRDVQAQVARYLLMQTPQGISNWTAYNPQLRSALSAAGLQTSGAVTR